MSFEAIDPSKAVDITLTKAKYRLPGRIVAPRDWERPSGDRGGVQFTRLYNGGRFQRKSENAGKAFKGQTIMPRMKSYWGNVLRKSH